MTIADVAELTGLSWDTIKEIDKSYLKDKYQSVSLSTGKLEVMNRKIGMLQRQSCGYRDDEYLKLRILNLHHATYALTG
ncbi:MAG: hypothetical protein A2Y07_10650 [Planctomycetes bacterium GWF2_50_10]|nr:MAG: hypothetical protein A2Y07_10650 [Planctomycetes bacterium GWF2_50_10]